MFGLSIKEKLYTAISKLSEQKIIDVKDDLRNFCNRFDSASDEKMEREYSRIIGVHSNAVSAALAEKMSSGIMYKVGFAIQSPHITGLPDEIDLDYLLSSGPKVGFYFAFYYYALTGKQISLDDYGKYIRPLNKRQLDLLTGVIQSLQNEKSKTNKRTNSDDTFSQFVDQISTKIGIDRDIAEEVANIVLFPPSQNEIYNRINKLEKTVISKYGASGLPIKFGGIIGVLLGNKIISKQDSDELLQRIQEKTIELLTAKNNNNTAKTSETLSVKQQQTAINQPSSKQQPSSNQKSLIEFIKEKAENGDSLAQNQLGHKYYYGEDVQADLNEAVKWYRLAAENGCCPAQYSLGVLYENGEGVTKNLSEAFRWYYAAAKQGDMDAQTNVANCYYSGNGTDKNMILAFRWYAEAAQQGSIISQLKLGYFYYDGAFIKKDYKMAFYWFEKAAENGNAEAMYNLAMCYETGTGVTQNEKEAYKWYTLADVNGFEDAAERLVPTLHLYDKYYKDKNMRINAIIEELTDLQEELDDLKSEEEDFRDDIPEDTIYSGLSEETEEISDNLENALSSLNETIESLDELIQNCTLKILLLIDKHIK